MDSWWKVAIFSAIGVAIVLMVGASARYGTGSFTFDQWMLIVVNWAVPLLSFAGFIAVYLGFQAQQEQNELQKQQYSIQNFERGFFQLMSFYNDIVNRITLTGRRGGTGERYRLTGRRAIGEYYVVLSNGYKRSSSDDERDVVNELYDYFHESNSSEFSHYYSTIETIIDYVVEKKKIESVGAYINILKSQLSDYEKVFLFYFGLSKHSTREFKAKMEHVGLLEQFPDKYVFSRKHKKFYDERAFERTKL
jgi:hypothetical protein